MAMPINEAIVKYKEYISAADQTKKNLEDHGLNIRVRDGFELGEEWTVFRANQKVAEVMWNVPYMLSFKPYTIQNEKEFFIDNVKNITDWKKFLKDIEHSLLVTENGES